MIVVCPDSFRGLTFGISVGFWSWVSAGLEGPSTLLLMVEILHVLI